MITNESEPDTTDRRLVMALCANPESIPTLLELVLLEDQWSSFEPILRVLTLTAPSATPNYPLTLLRFWEAALRTVLHISPNTPGVRHQLAGQARRLAEEVAGSLGLKLLTNPPPFQCAMMIPEAASARQTKGRSDLLILIQLPGRLRGTLRVQIEAMRTPMDAHRFNRSVVRQWPRKIVLTGGHVCDKDFSVIARCPAFVAHAKMRFPPWLGRVRRHQAIAAFALGRARCRITVDTPIADAAWFLDAFAWVCKTITFPPPIDTTPEKAQAALLTNEAYCAIERRDWATAKQKLLESLALWEAAPDTHSELALIYEHEGDFTTAELHLRRAIQLSPNSAKFYVNLAVCLLQQGKPVEARKAVETALRIDPQYPSAKEMLKYLVRHDAIYMTRIPKEPEGGKNPGHS